MGKGLGENKDCQSDYGSEHTNTQTHTHTHTQIHTHNKTTLTHTDTAHTHTHKHTDQSHSDRNFTQLHTINLDASLWAPTLLTCAHILGMYLHVQAPQQPSLATKGELW